MAEPPATVPIAREETERFEILEEAGSGGMGKVYRAKDRATGRALAVKVLREHDGDLSRFALEADILERLRHPAIVEYAYHGLTREGHPYLAMEWLDGETLERRLRAGPISVAYAVRIARALADALAGAHAAGVIHRDLKPSNVLLGKGGDVKLIDFGIAKSAEAQLTRTGDALGTPGYMAPEQARGARVDARSDLFSLGCVLFRCLAGRKPFEGADLMEYATNLALGTAPRLRLLSLDVPDSLDELVSRLLAKDAEGRPASAKKVADDLERIEDGEPLSDVTPTLTVEPRDHPDGVAPTALSPGVVAEPPRRSKPKRTSAVVTIVLAAVTAVGAGAYFARHRAMSDPSSTSTTETADERAVFDRACRTWGATIAKGQHADGSFSGETHRPPSGWDTAQQLFALAEAKRACGAVGPAPLVAGAKAIERMRTDDGVPGMAVDDKRGRTPANAWALLAVKSTMREVDDPSLAKLAATLRADLLRARNDDGGFRHLPAEKAPSVLYATLLAAWALDGDPEGNDARTWVERAIAAGAPGTTAVGMTEQIAWVVARDRHDDATARTLAAEIEAHCRFDAASKRCARPVFDTGNIALTHEPKNDLVTLWHPWLLLSSRALAKRGHERLVPIAHFAAIELGVAIDALSAAPEYKVAEYLLAVSEALTR